MSSPSRILLVPLLLASGCAGESGGGGGGPVTPPPAGPTAFTMLAGLASVLPGPGTLRIDFVPPATAGSEVAAFVSTDRATVFAGAAHVPVAGETSVSVSGLANGVRHHVGLGIRPTGGGTYEQTGPILSATPGDPLYVRPGAAGGGDGTTPATAYTLLEGVLNAFVRLLGDPATSVNLWLEGGTYPITSTLPVAAGVNVYGGFGADFDPATRDVEATPTIWSVASGQFGMQHSDEQLDAGLPVIVDGVRMTGNGVGRIGIDTNGTDPTGLELRSVVITDMVDRGIRLRNLGVDTFDVVMVACQSSRNGADGLNGNGPFDYFVHGCTFAQNAQEGFDLGDLVPEPGGTARLVLSSSLFFGNGFGTGAQALAEGLDCTLGLPLVPATGSYAVSIRGCSFERNALAGCLVDADFETVPGYSAEVVLRESRARANGEHGFQLDLDGPLDATQELSAFVHRVAASGNVLDGLYVGSESRAGLVGVSTSAFVGNGGAGLRAEGPPAATGNRTVLLTHSVLAGNGSAGMVSRDLTASATSCIAYLQPSPFDANTGAVASVTTSDPAAVAFASAPEEYARAVARSGAVLTLAAAPAFGTAAVLELADDGVARAAVAIAGTQVTLDASPDDFAVPGLLAAFPPGAAGVDEDYSLLPGSIALGAGLNGADAGPAGSAAPGTPGVADERPSDLFHPVAASPALGEIVGALDPLAIRFSAALDGASANGSTVVCRRGATVLNASLQTSGDTLTVTPPGGGWGAGDFRVELDGLRSSTGVELSGALVLPYQR